MGYLHLNIFILMFMYFLISEIWEFCLISTALQLFPSEAVGGANEAFQSLLRILGPEAALESVIRAFSLSQDP